MTANVNIDTETLPKKQSNHSDEICVKTAFNDYDNDTKSKMFYEFFLSKFSRKDTSLVGLEEYLSDLPKMDQASVYILDSPVSEAEISRAIDELSLQTLPGLDGLTAEFIQKFKEYFTKIFQWLWEEILNNEILPESQRCGLLSLIYKKDNPTELKNKKNS